MDSNLKKKLDGKYVKICIYASCTVLITCILGFLLVKSMPGVLMLLNMIKAILMPLVLGLVISYLLAPMVDRIEKLFLKLFKNLKSFRTGAVIVTLVIILSLVLLFFTLIIAMVTKEVSSIDFTSIRNVVKDMLADFKNVMNQISEFMNRLGIDLGNMGNMVTATAGKIANGASTFLFGLIFAIYLLTDGKNIGSYWKRVAQKLFTEKTLNWFAEAGKDANQCFSSYIRGQAVDALIVGVVTSIVFTAIGMPYGLLIGTITGVGNMIPYAGPILGYGSVIIVNILNWNPQMLFLGLGILLVIMFIDGNILNPKLLAGAINVHPLLVVAALLAGGAIGGIVGMLVAVPAGAFCRLRFEKWLSNRDRQGKTYAPNLSLDKEVRARENTDALVNQENLQTETKSK